MLAGPFCGYQLVRLGAEVIKVENPYGGDLARQLGAGPEMARRHMGLSFIAVNAAIYVRLTDVSKASSMDQRCPSTRTSVSTSVPCRHQVVKKASSPSTGHRRTSSPRVQRPRPGGAPSISGSRSASSR